MPSDSSPSVFNADAFLSQTTDAAGSTQYYPVPKGEYQGQILRVDSRRFEGKKNPGQWYTVLEIQWHVLGQEAQRATETEQPTARQTLFVDLTPSGGLDFGKNKNVQLSRLREALGQNKPGKKWGPTHLVGQTAPILIDHNVNEETGQPTAEVRRVGRPSGSTTRSAA